jgi:hypothetical protein
MFVVEYLDKVVEPGMRLKEVCSGELGGLFLQGQMHALMTAVLLGMPRFDPFHPA